MASRRGGNRIRGPQSALTDFLAANNISAAQIHDDYQRRRRQNDVQNQSVEDADLAIPQQDASMLQLGERATEVILSRSSTHQTNEDVSLVAAETRTNRLEVPAKSKTKSGSKKQISKYRKDSKLHSGKDVSSRLANGYEKARPLPGQFENCEICSKRFTVTPYSKEGLAGGLLCLACGKSVGKEVSSSKRVEAKLPRRKRRKIESERLDGVVGWGAKSLQHLCVERLALHHDDIDELGDISQPALDRLAQIFCKRRVLRSKTLPLFLRPDHHAVSIHDAAYLEVSDYRQIFSITPGLTKLVLENACQFKDEVMDYMLDRCSKLQHLHLYAANLVTDTVWQRCFLVLATDLRVLKLKWLDAAFTNAAVRTLAVACSNLERLKLELCRRLDERCITSITQLSNLKHLSLQFNTTITDESLVQLISSRGSKLETLSLRDFVDAGDLVLENIAQSCVVLKKLRISGNDTATDEGYAALFATWSNPALVFADFHATRDVDNNNPDGPDSPIGLASKGFCALMAHSRTNLKHLDIASCRHISLRAFTDVFNGAQNYPALEFINMSFCNSADTSVVAGIFRSCPALKRLVAFGCFNIHDVIVPRNIALIGVPRAQDAIEQYGSGIGVDEAIDRMTDAVVELDE